MTTESKKENNLIEHLKELKYKYRPEIIDRNTLEANFRKKFESLNRVNLTDSEFLRLRDEIITPDVFAASKLLRERQYFQREDGTPLHYTLVNIKDWCKNEFEVINQLRINTENSHQRYDVILLINGLPLVQIELKRGDVSHRNAMQQIVDYKNEPGNGYANTLLCFMQMFIVSNGSRTLYFANNRNEHFAFNADEQFLPVYEMATIKNRKINNLSSFTDAFLPKCTLGEMISKYMVLVQSEQRILVMRPYQIYAVKAIVSCINDNRGNGYIWHTTGSGKTLTSFKASTLLKDNPEIEKCLFVVDRKDLDRQTREEFNKFQEGSVEENTNTDKLVTRLLSDDYTDKVIVTTIQKLGLALDGTNRRNYKERLEPLSKKRIVFIFDECHRSQFGDNHKAIKEFFPNAQLFGFTGTPIFNENATYRTREGEYESYKTTEHIFEKSLHEYTITHAIEDKNVLKFHVDYYKGEGSHSAKPGESIAQQAVVEAILDKHNAATNQRKFNALLATSSINDAIEYYNLIKLEQARRVEADKSYKSLNIACVFSPPAQLIAKEGDQQSHKNAADIKQLQDDLMQEREDNQHEPEKKKEALENIISDFNKQYGTNHSISNFDSYYQDIQSRIKNQKWTNRDLDHKHKIDITIVVDMLLTGFDSKYLNTLYVDKNLKNHGLIQAFSRTNRVLNDTKPYGNILDFRSQRDAVNDAIALFSGEENENPSKIWLVDSAPVVVEKFKEAVEKLGIFMQDQNLACEPQDVYNLKGDAAKVAFIKNFKEVQKYKTQLEQYTDLSEYDSMIIESILPKEMFTEFKSSYLETAKQFKKRIEVEGDDTPEEILDLDFEFVLFASAIIDYDYIMELVAETTQQKISKQKMTKDQIVGLIRSHSNMMDEEEELSEYINNIDWSVGYSKDDLNDGYDAFKLDKFNNVVLSIANNNDLAVEQLHSFIEGIINRMIFDGEKLTDLLEPLDLGWRDRRDRELQIMTELVPLLKKLAQGREISGLAAYEKQ